MLARVHSVDEAAGKIDAVTRGGGRRRRARHGRPWCEAEQQLGQKRPGQEQRPTEQRTPAAGEVAARGTVRGRRLRQAPHAKEERARRTVDLAGSLPACPARAAQLGDRVGGRGERAGEPAARLPLARGATQRSSCPLLRSWRRDLGACAEQPRRRHRGRGQPRQGRLQGEVLRHERDDLPRQGGPARPPRAGAEVVAREGVRRVAVEGGVDGARARRAELPQYPSAERQTRRLGVDPPLRVRLADSLAALGRHGGRCLRPRPALSRLSALAPEQ
mmetsp:Transcript_12039/g.39318  ORF Transcript_12039/g.39318 Transcript_12039/m.39318 type:complete len:275 (-) Transcript_12039:1614-2438(-)